MKIFTFFNEKGGTGKTTLTAMFASYLAYYRGENVRVVDCDYPSYQLKAMRDRELQFIKDGTSPGFSRFVMQQGKDPFPLNKAMSKEQFSKADLAAIAAEIRRQCVGDGYMLLDFPGRFLEGDPSWDLIRRGMIDLVAFPVDTDAQSTIAAMNTRRQILQLNPRQKTVFVWNRETAQERRGTRDWYSGPEGFLRAAGAEVAATHVREVLIARREVNTFGFIRSTMCFPEVNIRKHCPSLFPLFEEMKHRLDGTLTRERYEGYKALKDLRDEAQNEDTDK